MWLLVDPFGLRWLALDLLLQLAKLDVDQTIALQDNHKLYYKMNVALLKSCNNMVTAYKIFYLYSNNFNYN